MGAGSTSLRGRGSQRDRGASGEGSGRAEVCGACVGGGGSPRVLPHLPGGSLCILMVGILQRSPPEMWEICTSLVTCVRAEVTSSGLDGALRGWLVRFPFVHLRSPEGLMCVLTVARLVRDAASIRSVLTPDPSPSLVLVTSAWGWGGLPGRGARARSRRGEGPYALEVSGEELAL